MQSRSAAWTQDKRTQRAAASLPHRAAASTAQGCNLVARLQLLELLELHRGGGGARVRVDLYNEVVGTVLGVVAKRCGDSVVAVVVDYL